MHFFFATTSLDSTFSLLAIRLIGACIRHLLLFAAIHLLAVYNFVLAAVLLCPVLAIIVGSSNSPLSYSWVAHIIVIVSMNTQIIKVHSSVKHYYNFNCLEFLRGCSHPLRLLEHGHLVTRIS